MCYYVDSNTRCGEVSDFEQINYIIFNLLITKTTF